MSRAARFAPIAIVSLAVALAGCGNAASSSAPTAAATGNGSSNVVDVEAAEYKFTPAALAAKAGSVTFRVHNGGAEEHEFEVFKGETVVDEIEGLVPGLTKELTLTLEAGDYTFFCKLNGHDTLGMSGTITVTPG